MEIEARNLRVSVKDPETGEMKELPFGQISLGAFEPEEHEDGRYSYTAKVTVTQRINRRTRKQLRYLFRPMRAPKYISKARMAKIIADRNSLFTYDQLIQMAAKRLKGIFGLILCADYASLFANLHQEPKHDYPCGGIVPKTQVDFQVNTNEAVVAIETATAMAEQLKKEVLL